MFSRDAIMYLFSLLWLWPLMGRIDALCGTQKLMALVLILSHWFFSPDFREGVWRCRALWQEPLSLSGFQVLARLLVTGKHGLLHRSSSLVDSTRGTQEHAELRPRCHSSGKMEKELFSLFYSAKKKMSSSGVREDRRAFFLKHHFYFVIQLSKL